MSKKKQGNDPFAEREARKYVSPIASREFIADLIGKHGSLTQKQLIKHLGYSQEDELEAIRRRVIAMLRDQQLYELENGALAVLDDRVLLRGTIAAHRDGFGFLIPDEGGDDLFLSFHEMRKVFDGDVVLVRELPSHRGKRHGEIVRVVEHKTTKLVGKLLVDKKQLRVVPENPKIQHTIFIEDGFTLNAEHEQIVVVEITQQPSARVVARGVVVKVLGERTAPGMEVQIALHEFGIPHEWPEAVLEQVKHFADEPSEQDKQHRMDLRDLPLMTIDGEDAKDFDDAVYCDKKAGGGWRLWVAIADVSQYVNLDSPLDQEALKRSTSVYFPDFVVPMLPEQLSNGLCSLKPMVDRLSLVCEMTISAKGRMSGYQFYPAVIRSHARLTYNEVWRMLEDNSASNPLRQQYGEISPILDNLYALYKALRSQRLIRGALDFDTVEAKPIFDEQRKIEGFTVLQRNDAHKLIEECMLCANIAAAKLVESLSLPVLYRVHEGPTEKKLVALRAYLQELGLSLAGGNEPTPRDYQALADAVAQRDDALLLQTMILRSMSQAVYQPENKGHFGLAYPLYTHFTSPIRRYPDLLVHRLIHYAIAHTIGHKHLCVPDSKKTQLSKKPYFYSMDDMVQMGVHCSMAERRADDASRDVLSSLKAQFLQQYVGDVFTGSISTVTSFGLFVELDDLYTEGLVHVSEMDNDFYHYDNKQRLIGERTRRVFRMGDRVKVQLKEVDLEERKIHLILLDQLTEKGKKVVKKVAATEKPSKKAKKEPAKKVLKRRK
jgi:ribonuclease R